MILLGSVVIGPARSQVPLAILALEVSLRWQPGFLLPEVRGFASHPRGWFAFGTYWLWQRPYRHKAMSMINPPNRIWTHVLIGARLLPAWSLLSPGLLLGWSLLGVAPA